MRIEQDRWRVIPGTSNTYAASWLGKIKRILGGVRGTHAGKILKPIPAGKGYYKVNLSIAGKRKSILVHVAVALAWLGPPPAGCDVNHKDGKKWRNRADNLEYMTKKQNNEHAIRVLGKVMPNGERHARAKVSDALCVAIRKRVADGETCAAVAADLGISRPQVSRIYSHKSRKLPTRLPKSQ